MNNLWDDLTFLEDDKIMPVDILKEQSEFLNDSTNGLLYIDTQVYNEIDNMFMGDYEFGYKYILKSNVLPDYGYRILEVQHNMNIFPLSFVVNDDLLDELKKKNENITEVISMIQNEKDLISVISDTLNSKMVKDTIHALYRISKSQVN